MARFLERLGRYCVRRRRTVIEIWIALILATGYLGLTHGGMFVQQSSLPGTETQKAIDTLKADFPSMSGPYATVVFESTEEASPADWRVAVNIGQSIDNLSKLDRVAFVANPYIQGMGGLKNANTVVAHVYLKGTLSDISKSDLEAFDRATAPAEKVGIGVRYGGIVAMILNQPTGSASEGVGLVLALVVLLVAFGSYLAAAVPIVVSLAGLAIAYSLIHFGASIGELHPTAPMIAAMLGLGAGIDYALFIVTRYRQQLQEGDDVETAVGHAMAHSGHAVVFAGGTVVFAICGLFLSGISFIGRIGIGAALTVGLMVGAALTLLPAILGVLGTRIDRFKLPRSRPDRSVERWMRWGRHVDRRAWPYAVIGTAVLVTLAIPMLSLRFGVMSDSIATKSQANRQAYDAVAQEFGPGHYSPFIIVAKTPDTKDSGGSAKGGKDAEGDAKGGAKDGAPADDVPTINGLGGLAGFGAPQAEQPAGSSTKDGAAGGGTAKEQAGKDAGKVDGKVDGKNGGKNDNRDEQAAASPIKGAPMTTEKPNPATVLLAQELRQRLAEADGVAFAAEPVVVRNTAVISLFPTTAPHEEATSDLVDRLRSIDIPVITDRHPGSVVYLGGENPAIMDVASVVQDRMLNVVLAVVGVALLLLVIAFKSIVVPIKAALMNLLSIGASYGVVTAVFQWGWGSGILGLDGPVPIMSFIPLFMFALIFGLSMDYEVFLLSRIKEEYDRSNDAHESVVVGIASTARLITSAAFIMIFVFVGFLPQPDPTVKMMALGLAVAVAIDATIVRLMLVPALMSLLGHANWWWPFGKRPAAAEPAPEAPAAFEPTAEAGSRAVGNEKGKAGTGTNADGEGEAEADDNADGKAKAALETVS